MFTLSITFPELVMSQINRCINKQMEIGSKEKPAKEKGVLLKCGTLE
jgi:hypothetical protein